VIACIAIVGMIIIGVMHKKQKDTSESDSIDLQVLGDSYQPPATITSDASDYNRL
jgi:hypothetical protein